MRAFFRFEWRRIFREKKNLVSLGCILLLSIYFVLSGLNEYRQFQVEKGIFLRFEKEKVGHLISYSQYGGFGFRILFEASPLNLFFVNSGVLQDVQSNIDTFEAIKVESSFKGNKLFLRRGFFKDFAGVPFVFGSLLMLYLGHLALVSPAHLRFMMGRMSMKKYYFLTTAARLFWLNLYFAVLGLGLFLLVRLLGVEFSPSDRLHFLAYLLVLVLLLDFFYLLGQLTALLAGFRRIFFLWFFVVWFVCIFLLPEISRISVFSQSQVLESAEKVNLEKFRTLMSLEKQFRDYLKENPSTRLDQLRKMQKQFAVQFINSTYLVNTGLETRYLRDVERVITRHERQSLLFPTTYYQYLAGEVSGKGYQGYIDFMNYIMRLRSRFIRFYLNKRYGENDAAVESFVKGHENIFRSRSRLPGTAGSGILLMALYGAALCALGYWRLRRLVLEP
ncbi:MAG: hypothetical protein JXO51_12190 [Candidatus Aminicenantes bacterium]|nr:hypothetical protein [Candidatus Aminicenantes bacterium]